MQKPKLQLEFAFSRTAGCCVVRVPDDLTWKMYVARTSRARYVDRSAAQPTLCRLIGHRCGCWYDPWPPDVAESVYDFVRASLRPGLKRRLWCRVHEQVRAVAGARVPRMKYLDVDGKELGDSWGSLDERDATRDDLYCIGCGERCRLDPDSLVDVYYDTGIPELDPEIGISYGFMKCDACGRLGARRIDQY